MWWNLFVGALVAALLAALGISFLSRFRRLPTDTAIGVVFSGMLALGVSLMSVSKSYRDFSHILFGIVLSVSSFELASIAMTAGLVLISVRLLYKELVVTSFDPLRCQSIGLSASRLQLLLLLLLALTVVVDVQAVGVMLTTALMITPAATAALLSHQLYTRLVCAVTAGCTASVAGLYASYYGNVSSGAAIVLCSCVEFVLALFVSRWSQRDDLPRRRSFKKLMCIFLGADPKKWAR